MRFLQWLYGPGVCDERVLIDQNRRFQLRDARAGDREREEEHRPASRRRENRPVELREHLSLFKKKRLHNLHFTFSI